MGKLFEVVVVRKYEVRADNEAEAKLLAGAELIGTTACVLPSSQFGFTEAMRKYGLTLAEARIFAVLQTGFISSDQMSELIGRNSNWHFTRSAAVHISNIRGKTGLDIKSVRGKGYALTNLNNT